MANVYENQDSKRVEMLSDFFFNLSKISFAGILLGALFFPFDSSNTSIVLYFAVLLVATIAFAYAGIRVLK